MICALLFFGTTINYVDRQALSFLGTRLETDLGIGDADFGKIGAAFAMAYAIGQTFAGRWLDIVGTRIGYAISLTLWSFAAIAHGFVTTPLGFGIARLFLGLAESPCYPANNKTTAEWFPKKERSTVMGFVNAGSNLGVIIAAVMAVPLYTHFGFKGVFICTGGIGFIWLAFWLPMYRKPEEHPKVTKAELEYIHHDVGEEAPEVVNPASWMDWAKFMLIGLFLGSLVGWLLSGSFKLGGKEAIIMGLGFGVASGIALCVARPILHHRQTWAFAASKFITDAIWYFFIFWIAKFLAARHHIDIKNLGMPFIVIYTMADVGSIVGGWLSSGFMHRGMSTNSARKLGMIICIACIIPVIFATVVSKPWICIILLGMATAGHQGFSANQYSIVGDMFPKRMVAAVSGFGGTLGYIGASLYSLVCGKVLSGNGNNYTPLMIIAGCGYVVAFAIIQLFSPKLERIK